MLYEYFGFAYSPMVAAFSWSTIIIIIIGVAAHLAVFKPPIFDSLLKEPLAALKMVLPAAMFSFLSSWRRRPGRTSPRRAPR